LAEVVADPEVKLTAKENKIPALLEVAVPAMKEGPEGPVPAAGPKEVKVGVTVVTDIPPVAATVSTPSVIEPDIPEPATKDCTTLAPVSVLTK